MSEVAGFIRENIFANAAITATNEAVGYPPTNVVDPRHDRVYRSTTGLSSLNFDCGAPVTIGAIVIRWPSERDPALTPAPIVAPPDSILIEASNVGPSLSEIHNAVISPTQHPRLGYLTYILRDGGGALAPATARYWAIEVTTASAYFEVENVFAGPIWTPAFNYNRGVSWSIDENAEIGRSSFTGGVFAEARSRLLEFSGSWDVWSASELDEWEEFFLSHGITKPFALLRRLTGDLSKRSSISVFDSKPIATDRDGAHFFVRASFKEHR